MKFWQGNKVRNYLGHAGVGERTSYFVKKQDVKVGTRFIWLALWCSGILF
jgi:hypothetical protein